MKEKLAALKQLSEILNEKQDRLDAIARRVQVIKAQVANATEHDLPALEAKIKELAVEIPQAVAEANELRDRVRKLIADIYRSPFVQG